MDIIEVAPQVVELFARCAMVCRFVKFAFCSERLSDRKGRCGGAQVDASRKKVPRGRRRAESPTGVYYYSNFALKPSVKSINTNDLEPLHIVQFIYRINHPPRW
jgi:hypothetical protein